MRCIIINAELFFCHSRHFNKTINLISYAVVQRIVETDVNIPNYQLVTFNDFGPDINRNVKVFPPTPDVMKFR